MRTATPLPKVLDTYLIIRMGTTTDLDSVDAPKGFVRVRDEPISGPQESLEFAGLDIPTLAATAPGSEVIYGHLVGGVADRALDFDTVLCREISVRGHQPIAVGPKFGIYSRQGDRRWASTHVFL
jgi:hypothetical protein